MAKWRSNLKDCGDRCFLCFNRFATRQYVAFMPQHPKEYAHMHCISRWFESINETAESEMPKCPLCNCKAFMTCVECSKVMSASETIYNFHDHPGYHICVRCVAFSANVMYEPVIHEASGFYRGTAACIWCSKNKYGGNHTAVSLADVVPKEMWPMIKCFKQLQISMLTFSHHLAKINGHTSAIRLRDAYLEFFN